MKTKNYMLENLDENSVNIISETSTEINGENYTLGRYRKSFSNSNNGREMIKKELPEKYYNAVMEVWGNIPTINDMDNDITE